MAHPIANNRTEYRDALRYPFVVLIAAGSSVALFAAQVVQSNSSARREGELTAQEASIAASAALARVGVDIGDRTRMLVQLRDFVRGHRKWECWSDPYTYLCKVDAASGELMSYYNEARRHEQYRGLGRTGRQYFQSEAQAKNRIRTLANLLGVSASTTLTGFAWQRDGEVRDQNSAGSVGAVFKNSEGQVVATISLDPQDGVLVTFSRTRF